MSSSERINENGHLSGPEGRASASGPEGGARVVELELKPSVGDQHLFVRALPEETARLIGLAFEVLASGDELGCFSILNRLPSGTNFGMAYNVLGSLMGKTIVAGSMVDAEKIIRSENKKTGH